MNKPSTVNGNDAPSGVCIKPVSLAPTLRKFFLPGFALLALSLLASSAGAQSFIRIKAGQLRVTAPLNSTMSSTISNNISLSGFTSGTGPTLTVTGLPAGAGASLSTTNPVTSGAVMLTVNTTNVPEGVYRFSLNAGGTDSNSLPVTNNLFFTLQVGYIWNGGTNVAVNGPG
jgi:hypothetical protein